MTKLNVTRAAKASGLTRTTLYRKMEAGQLSFTLDGTGGRLIDTAELGRLVGHPVDPDTVTGGVQRNVKDTGKDAPQDSDLVALLKEQLAHEREQSRWLRDQLEAALQKALPAGRPGTWWQFWK